MLASINVLSTQEVEDLVSFLIGEPFTLPPEGVAPVPFLPPPPPLVTASSATVARWATLERLPKAAVPGAKLFAKTGCLSCHTYLGAGSKRLRAPDLTAIGAKRKGVRYFRRFVAKPYEYGTNLMPTYADLGDANLTRIAVFLDASKGRVRR